MLARPKVAWAVVHASTGKMVIFDARAPVYWLRRIAQDAANDHGFTTTGKAPDVRICAVEMKQYSPRIKR